MKAHGRSRSILHVDLSPFFISVERSLDPALRGRAVVVGGADGLGRVAAASDEAQALGVRPGMALAAALERCPRAVVRAGDLERYAGISDEVTSILLAVSRRVDRPSADEAYVDLTPEGGRHRPAVPAAEAIKDDIQRRLGLDASLGLASSRLAARVASGWARPRGLLVVLPGYESAFMSRQPITVIADLTSSTEAALRRAGITTVGELAGAAESVLTHAVGPAALRLQAIARGEEPDPIAVAAPPAWIQDEAVVREPAEDGAHLQRMLEALVARGARRLRPFGAATGHVTVEVRRGDLWQRRDEVLEPGLQDESSLLQVATALAEPLLQPAAAVRALRLRLGRVARAGADLPLFPGALAASRRGVELSGRAASAR